MTDTEILENLQDAATRRRNGATFYHPTASLRLHPEIVALARVGLDVEWVARDLARPGLLQALGDVVEWHRAVAVSVVMEAIGIQSGENRQTNLSALAAVLPKNFTFRESRAGVLYIHKLIGHLNRRDWRAAIETACTYDVEAQRARVTHILRRHVDRMQTRRLDAARALEDYLAA